MKEGKKFTVWTAIAMIGLFLFYVPMRIILTPIFWVPVPNFVSFVDHPEIVKKWSMWFTSMAICAGIYFGLHFFLPMWWALSVMFGLAVVLLILNMLVARKKIEQYEREKLE